MRQETAGAYLKATSISTVPSLTFGTDGWTGRPPVRPTMTFNGSFGNKLFPAYTLCCDDCTPGSR